MLKSSTCCWHEDILKLSSFELKNKKSCGLWIVKIWGIIFTKRVLELTYELKGNLIIEAVDYSVQLKFSNDL